MTSTYCIRSDIGVTFNWDLLLGSLALAGTALLGRFGFLFFVIIREILILLNRRARFGQSAENFLRDLSSLFGSWFWWSGWS